MKLVALSFLLLVVRQDLNEGLDVTVSLASIELSPLQPVKIRIAAVNTSSRSIPIRSGLEARGIEVWIAKSGCSFARVHLGSSPMVTTSTKLELGPGETFMRSDILSHSVDTGLPLFPESGKYQLKVVFQKKSSPPISVEVKPLPITEDGAVKIMTEKALFRQMTPLKQFGEEPDCGVLDNLTAFLAKEPKSVFGPYVCFAFGIYSTLYDSKLAKNETPDQCRSRREKSVELLSQALERLPHFTSEVLFYRGRTFRALGMGKSALDNIARVLERKDTAPYIISGANSALDELKSSSITGDAGIDWNK